MSREFKQKTKGFTLLELLVVIVLLGVVSSFAVLSLNITGLETELEQETKKIHALINLAKEEAIIQAQEIALVVGKQSYFFQYFDWNNKGWSPKEDKIFRQRKIHEGLKIYLETETEKNIFKKEDDDEEELNRVFFLSSGEQSKFIVKISIREKEQNYFQIIGEINGALKIEKNSNFEI